MSTNDPPPVLIIPKVEDRACAERPVRRLVSGSFCRIWINACAFTSTIHNLPRQVLLNSSESRAMRPDFRATAGPLRFSTRGCVAAGRIHIPASLLLNQHA